MIDGRKDGEPAEQIRSLRPLVAMLFLALTAAWTFSLVDG
jgi:hypothetical protein